MDINNSLSRIDSGEWLKIGILMFIVLVLSVRFGFESIIWIIGATVGAFLLAVLVVLSVMVSQKLDEL